MFLQQLIIVKVVMERNYCKLYLAQKFTLLFPGMTKYITGCTGLTGAIVNITGR